MRRVSSYAAAVAVAAAVASRLPAQDAGALRCPGGSPGSQALIAQDACQQAYDIYQFMAPQLGLALAGGNATAGTGSVLGGIGHFSVGVRANVFGGLVPDVGASGFDQSINGAQQRTLPTKSQILGLPTADAAIGLFKGFPLALTNVLGVDALVSAEYVPTIHSGSGDFSLEPSSSVHVGYGARVGLLSESIAFPAVSVTWIERDLPSSDITSVDNGDTLGVFGAQVKTRAWRVVASKSLIAFAVAVGAGQDKYDQSATIRGSVSEGGFTGSQSVAVDQSLTRTNVFADLALNLPLLKIVGEVGNASGGSVATYNSFSGGAADRSQLYGSIGLRFSW